MLVAVGFWAFVVASYAVVLLYGGREARIFIHFVLLAALATLVAFITLAGTEYGLAILAIDGALLVAGLYFVARTQSFWPVWFCGFHLIGVATSSARWLFPNELPEIYGNLAGFWAIPALMTMVIAVIRDRQSQSPSGAFAHGRS